MSKPQAKVSYKNLLQFFLPLAIAPIMLYATFPIIDSALARLPFPELTLAAFTVVKSIGSIISAPTLMFPQVVVSLVNNKKTYYLTTKFMLSASILMLLFLMVLGYTPLGEYVLRNLVGLREPKQIEFAHLGFTIVCFLPLVELLRDINQGLIISLKKTEMFVPGVVIRVALISIFLFWTVKTRLISGILAGSLSWVLGIGIEGIFLMFYLRYKYGSAVRSVEQLKYRNHKEVSLAQITRFFLPLGFMISLTALLQPVIQGGIARSSNAVQSLAAYGLAWGLISVMAGPLRLLHQLSLVYTKELDDNNWGTVLKFSIMTGLFISGLILLVAMTPIGFWLLDRVIAVSEEINIITREVMIAFALYPLIRSFREAYWGNLMYQRSTTVIGLAKIINFMVVVLVLVSGFKILPAVLGALAFTIGEGMESLLVWLYAKGKRGKRPGVSKEQLKKNK